MINKFLKPYEYKVSLMQWLWQGDFENYSCQGRLSPEGGRTGGKEADCMCLLSRLPRRKWARLQTSLSSMNLGTEKDCCKPLTVRMALFFYFRGWVCTDLHTYTCLGPDQWHTLSEATIVNTSGPRWRLLCACKWHSKWLADQAKRNQISQAQGSWNSLLVHRQEALPLCSSL